MNFVLDASVTLSWCFGDESTDMTVSLLQRLDRDTAFVPHIWPLEIGSVLLVAERKGRISYAHVSQFLNHLESLNITVDTSNTERSLRETLTLAHAEKLTTYDASYLELAIRLGLPLYTKDQQLYKVACGLGVECPLET